MDITSDDSQEELAQEASRIVGHRASHAKVQKSNNGLIRTRAALDKNIARMRICVKKAFLEKLAKIRVYRTSGNFQSINFESVEHSIIIDLDTIDPFKDNDAPCDVLFIHTWNINSG